MLLTDHYWSLYLRKLRETFWPNGEWSEEYVLGRGEVGLIFQFSTPPHSHPRPEPEPTAEEQLAQRREALMLLQLFFPPWVKLVTGDQRFNGGLRALLHLLHLPRLNQHLLHHILDVLLLHLLQHDQAMAARA